MVGIALAVFVLAAGVGGCVRDERARVRFDDVTVKAVIADEYVERDRGLQDRKRLGEDEGMLFVWPDEDVRVFGIKGVDYALDLVFIDDGGTVVGIAGLDPDGSTIASSAARARFVLEVPAGFVRRHSISYGDRVSIEGVD